MKPFCYILIVVAAGFLFWQIVVKLFRQAVKESETEELAPCGRRIIRVKSMSHQKLDEAFRELKKMYDSDGEFITPEVVWDGDSPTLIFTKPVDFWMFCWWVNYLVYSEKGTRYDAVGWYEAQEFKKINGQDCPLDGKTLMMFVPDTDEEYDNVYITIPDNRCYKLGFDNPCRLEPQRYPIKPYEPMPELKSEN